MSPDSRSDSIFYKADSRHRRRRFIVLIFRYQRRAPLRDAVALLKLLGECTQVAARRDRPHHQSFDFLQVLARD